jgi:hypothetical protein
LVAGGKIGVSQSHFFCKIWKTILFIYVLFRGRDALLYLLLMNFFSVLGVFIHVIMVDPQNLVPHVCNKELVSLFGIAIFQNKASLNQVQNYL